MALLTVVDTESALVDDAANRIATSIEHAISARGNALVSLAGGRTPAKLYASLADPARPWRARIDWSLVHLFWGDERHVPPDHPDSNFGLAYDALIKHVDIPATHVHRIVGEHQNPEHAAQQYETALEGSFAAAGRDELTFDLMLLGLGADAHIASIFPNSPLFSTNDTELPARRVAAVWVPHLNAWRITLTVAAVLDARRILVLVRGQSKAEAVSAALEQPEDVCRWPAQLLRRAGKRVEWIIDCPAAQTLHDLPH